MERLDGLGIMYGMIGLNMTYGLAYAAWADLWAGPIRCFQRNRFNLAFLES